MTVGFWLESAPSVRPSLVLATRLRHGTLSRQHSLARPGATILVRRTSPPTLAITLLATFPQRRLPLFSIGLIIITLPLLWNPRTNLLITRVRRGEFRQFAQKALKRMPTPL